MSDQFWQIFFASASGAGVITFLLKVLEKFFDEWRAVIKRKSEDLRDFGNSLLIICNEASSSSYVVLPRDREHINELITKAELLTPDIVKDLEIFHSNWTLYSYEDCRIQGNASAEDISFGIMLRDGADSARKKIIKRAHQLLNS